MNSFFVPSEKLGDPIALEKERSPWLCPRQTLTTSGGDMGTNALAINRLRFVDTRIITQPEIP